MGWSWLVSALQPADKFVRFAWCWLSSSAKLSISMMCLDEGWSVSDIFRFIPTSTLVEVAEVSRSGEVASPVEGLPASMQVKSIVEVSLVSPLSVDAFTSLSV